MVGNCGILYIATGERYVDDARMSATSVKQHSPDLPVAIVSTDEIIEEQELGLFDHVIRATVVNDDVSDKLYNLQLTPFDYTLYLDNDTLILKPIQELFGLLKKYDIAIMPGENIVDIEGIPPAFKEPNGGVILYKKNSRFDTFMKNWIRTYEQQIDNVGWVTEDSIYAKLETASSFGTLHDQPSLRKSLWDTQIRYVPLPQEFNFKGGINATASDVHILHFGWMMPRHVRDNLREEINKHQGPRVKFYDEILWKDFPNTNIYSKRYRIYKYLIKILNYIRLPETLDRIGFRERTSNLKTKFERDYF
jgi:hypothetical protein